MPNEAVTEILDDLNERIAALEPVHEQYLRLVEIRRVVLRENGKAPPKKREAGTDRAKDFKRVLKDHGPMNVKAVADILDMNPNYLYRVANRLIDSGEVTMTVTDDNKKLYSVINE